VCYDLELSTGGEWYDIDGPEYNCAWYEGVGLGNISWSTSWTDWTADWYTSADIGVCGVSALEYENGGFTASTACCACNGGWLDDNDVCNDVQFMDGTPWYDSDGPYYTCTWYATAASEWSWSWSDSWADTYDTDTTKLSSVDADWGLDDDDPNAAVISTVAAASVLFFIMF
jgi:hypothetical protein